MKKIINQPQDVVLEMCRGIVLAHPSLKFDEKYKVITRKSPLKNKVVLISGGGSGHEPAHAGFVGTGMLDAAVCGDVFASPSQIQVYQAIKNTKTAAGTLLIIKNYSGDVMNFRNAAAMAEDEGINIDYVLVDDDIAVENSLYTVGRRGVAGTVFVHKAAGAAAERGYDLSEVKRIAKKTADQVRSIGFALTSCTVPAKGTPTFSLGEDEIEFGVGIHGEPGIQREKISSADELAEKMVSAILSSFEFQIATNNQTEPSVEVALLVNGFGSTPLQELYLLNNSVTRILQQREIKIHKTLVGNYMTSLDMAGASISLLLVDEELKGLLDSGCDAPAMVVKAESDAEYWRRYNSPLDGTAETKKAINSSVDEGQDITASLSETLEETNLHKDQLSPTASINLEGSSVIGEKLSIENFIYMINKMSETAIKKEIEFCELDSHAGDGDFGMSLAKGFRQLKLEWPRIIAEEASSIGSLLDACSLVIMEHCGGASGPIWGSAFRYAAKSVEGKVSVDATEFADMLNLAVIGIQTTGKRSFGRGAEIGDKTLIDALIPTVSAWKSSAAANLSLKQALMLGAEAAVEGAQATKKIAARMGRAGTVGDRSIGYPDAGAHGLAIIFTAIAESMTAVEVK